MAVENAFNNPELIQSLSNQGNWDGLMEAIVKSEPYAAMELPSLGENPVVGKQLATYYSAYLWILFMHKEKADLKNLTGKLAQTRLHADKTFKMTNDAALALLEYDFKTVFDQQQFWQEQEGTEKKQSGVAPLALASLVKLRQELLQFVQQQYTVISPAQLKHLLAFDESAPDEEVLSMVNQEMSGFELDEDGLVVVPHTEQDQAKPALKSDDDKRAKIDELVKLASSLEQERYINQAN